MIVPFAAYAVWSANWFFLIAALGLAVLGGLLTARPDIGLGVLLVVRSSVEIFGDHTVALGGLTMNLTLSLSAVAIVWSLWYLLQQRVRFWRTPLFWPLAALLVISAFSLTYSIAPAETVEETIRLAGFFLLYLVAVHVITTPERFHRFAFGLGWSMVVPALLGTYQFVTHTGQTFSDGTNRVFGTFAHPNVFAFFLLLGLSFFLALFIQHARRRHAVPFLLLVWLAALLVLTGTRGAWVGLGLVLLTLGAVRFRRQLAVTAVIVAVGLAISPMLLSIASRYTNVDVNHLPVIGGVVERITNKSSYQWRLDLWREMGPKFLHRPLLGYGLGSFPILRQYQVFDFFQGVGAHNDYFRLAIETGAVGLLIFLSLLVAIVRALIRAYRRAPVDSQVIVLAMAGFVLAYAFMSFFDNLLQATAAMWAFWLALGAVVGLHRASAAEPAMTKKKTGALSLPVGR